MPENSTVTTEIDVEAAISEIAEMEVSNALENVSERTEAVVSESETLAPDSLNETENIETEITAVTEISEFAEEQVMTVSEETFTTPAEDNILALPPETTAAAVTNETSAVTAAAENVTVYPKTELAANQVLMPAIVAVLAIAAFIVKKTGGKKKDSERKYAKDRDAERLNADKPAKKKRKA